MDKNDRLDIIIKDYIINVYGYGISPLYEL